jgi:aconitate hydratase
VLRNCDGRKVTAEHVKQLAQWAPNAERKDEIPFVVSRVVLQDFTGVPLLATWLPCAARGASGQEPQEDRAAGACGSGGGPLDHGGPLRQKNSLDLNMKLEFQRNRERYEFMKWGMQAFDTFGVVPPGFGIVHQVNLEYLARGVHKRKDGVYYPTPWWAPTATPP